MPSAFQTSEQRFIHSSASAVLLWSEAAQIPDSGGAVRGEVGVTPAVCTPVLR